jgi:mRNA-degrading endonuclease RelE of RelBE toxin-antitoxin system
MPIDLLPGALLDLKSLRTADPKALAVVAAFLQEAESDNELILKWTMGDGDIAIGQFNANVKRWIKGSNFIGNLFRIRVLNTPATEYRIVYGYDWHTQRIGVLAVLHKSVFDYEIKSELADRIKSDWDFATGGRAT